MVDHPDSDFRNAPDSSLHKLTQASILKAANPASTPLLPAQFSVLTWNVLADSYASTGQFTNCTKDDLSFSLRAPRLMEILKRADVDILTLQEVDRLDSFWHQTLSSMGYNMVFSRRGGVDLVYAGPSFDSPSSFLTKSVGLFPRVSSVMEKALQFCTCSSVPAPASAPLRMEEESLGDLSIPLSSLSIDTTPKQLLGNVVTPFTLPSCLVCG